jgi:hypothetical protein
MSVQAQPERQAKHTEIWNAHETLSRTIGELWQLVYKINPGLAKDKGAAEEDDFNYTLSETLRILPGKIQEQTAGLREAIETLEGELF